MFFCNRAKKSAAWPRGERYFGDEEVLSAAYCWYAAFRCRLDEAKMAAATDGCQLLAAASGVYFWLSMICFRLGVMLYEWKPKGECRCRTGARLPHGRGGRFGYFYRFAGRLNNKKAFFEGVLSDAFIDNGSRYCPQEFPLVAVYVGIGADSIHAD